MKQKENEHNTNIEHRRRVRLISYFYALAGCVTSGERICWFACHGFYPDWCISSGAKLLRFKYAFIIWCRVLLLLISHNTRLVSDVLHQSLYTLHTHSYTYTGSIRLPCSLLFDIEYVMMRTIYEQTFCQNFLNIFWKFRKKVLKKRNTIFFPNKNIKTLMFKENEMLNSVPIYFNNERFYYKYFMLMHI